ncbi:MAG TPA: MerR family transcriptional regulator [Allosphingosinicella sp.]
MAAPESSRKGDQAFRTIGELADELGVPQHILRYWETRFPQLRPLQRAGNRRYYRPTDVALAHRIHRLLNEDGYTIRGVQQLLAGNAGDGEELVAATGPTPANQHGGSSTAEELRAIRKSLREALDKTD